MLQSKNESFKTKVKQKSEEEVYQPPRGPKIAPKRQPKQEPPQQGDDKLRSSDSETENPDSIYFAALVDLILKEIELEENEREDILISWENARQTGQLDEYVNSEPMA